jgi:hypothetical protein
MCLHNINITVENQDEIQDCTVRRLRKMFKYFCSKNEPLQIKYEYNNSMGAHQIREYKGIPERWDISVTALNTYEQEFRLMIWFTDGKEMEEYLSSNWEFYGLGRLKMCNSGPYCYFTIRFQKK